MLYWETKLQKTSLNIVLWFTFFFEFQLTHSKTFKDCTEGTCCDGVCLDDGVKRSNLVGRVQIALPITAAFAPESQVIVYYVRTDGEVVSSFTRLEVENCFDNKVGFLLKNVGGCGNYIDIINRHKKKTLQWYRKLFK